MLRVIDNPAQDIYLAAAMLGPMFGFTDDDLVRLRAGAQTPDKRTRISLYGAVLQAVQSGAEDDFTRRVQAFYQRLTALRRMARSVPVEELLEEIFVSTGYLAALGAMENGTVTANPTAAKAGATVTLTPVPDEGYALSILTVTDRFGDAVRVTENSDGTYTFTMPNGQVTVTVTFEQAPLPFHDVTEGDWFYDAVRYAYETGLMDGVGDNLFAPNSQTTRAQLVTILYRLEGEPAVSGDLPFTDVETGTWYTNAVLWAAQNGIVNGVTDTTFAPGDNITRQQLVTILYRYAEAKGYDVSASADLSGYPDAGQVQDYAQPAMAWAVAENIIQGMEDGTLKPAGNASRAQIAAVLMRFCQTVAE